MNNLQRTAFVRFTIINLKLNTNLIYQILFTFNNLSGQKHFRESADSCHVVGYVTNCITRVTNDLSENCDLYIF